MLQEKHQQQVPLAQQLHHCDDGYTIDAPGSNAVVCVGVCQARMWDQDAAERGDRGARQRLDVRSRDEVPRHGNIFRWRWRHKTVTFAHKDLPEIKITPGKKEGLFSDMGHWYDINMQDDIMFSIQLGDPPKEEL